MDIQLFVGCEPSPCVDLGLSCGDLATNNTLVNALMISLFTDRRANDDDVLPKSQSDMRGWWGDALDGFYIGSRLWLLESEKPTKDIPQRAIGYVREATQWIVDDGIADSVAVDCEYIANCFGENCKDTLGISVTLCRPKDNDLNFKFRYAWQNFELQGCEVNGCELPKIEYCPSYPMINGGFGFLASDLRDPKATVKITSCGNAPDVWIFPSSGLGHTMPVLGYGCEVIGYAQNSSKCEIELEC